MPAMVKRIYSLLTGFLEFTFLSKVEQESTDQNNTMVQKWIEVKYSR